MEAWLLAALALGGVAAVSLFSSDDDDGSDSSTEEPEQPTDNSVTYTGNEEPELDLPAIDPERATAIIAGRRAASRKASRAKLMEPKATEPELLPGIGDEVFREKVITTTNSIAAFRQQVASRTP